MTRRTPPGWRSCRSATTQPCSRVSAPVGPGQPRAVFAAAPQGLPPENISPGQFLIARASKEHHKSLSAFISPALEEPR